MRRDGKPEYGSLTSQTFAALVLAFKDSPKFKGYAASTRVGWGSELEWLARPTLLGRKLVDELKPSQVQAVFDGISDRPGKQHLGLSALRQLEKWAIVRELLPRQITIGVEVESLTGGHTPWTDEQVALAEKYAKPDIARVITLGANTGQRGSDLIRMCPTDIEIYKGRAGIKVIQQKTGREVWVPITSALAAAMETWERQPGPFLRRMKPKRGSNPDTETLAWTRVDLTHAWVYERDTNPALVSLKEAGLVLHGLRGHACVRLLRDGCNTRQVCDLVGMSEEMVGRYTRFSTQRENASAAIYHLEQVQEKRGKNTTTSFNKDSQVIDIANPNFPRTKV